MMPTDAEIRRALCCGDKCLRGHGYCHALDFIEYSIRIRALLNQPARPPADDGRQETATGELT